MARLRAPVESAATPDERLLGELLGEYVELARALCDQIAQGNLESAREHLARLEEILARASSIDARSRGDLAPEQRRLVGEALALLGLGQAQAGEQRSRLAGEIKAARAIRAHLNTALEKDLAAGSPRGLDRDL